MQVNQLSDKYDMKARAVKAPRLFALAEVADPVEQHGEDDGAADEGALPERVDAEQAEAVADDLDEGRADQRAEGGADRRRRDWRRR